MVDRYAPGFWYAKAEETLARAEEMQDQDARSTMLQIAIMYDAMALRMETRLADHAAAAA
jgi:hypothetical protein